jgi:hypothetical protein
MSCRGALVDNGNASSTVASCERRPKYWSARARHPCPSPPPDQSARVSPPRLWRGWPRSVSTHVPTDRHRASSGSMSLRLRTLDWKDPYARADLVDGDDCAGIEGGGVREQDLDEDRTDGLG